MSVEQNRRLMSLYLEQVLGQRQFDHVADIAAPDMIDHTQPGKTGPAALDAHARGFCANTPDVKIVVLKVIADENSAVGIWRWEGEPGQPSAISAKGSPVVPRLICSVFDIEGGRVRDYRAFVDAVDVFTQLAR